MSAPRSPSIPADAQSITSIASTAGSASEATVGATPSTHAPALGPVDSSVPARPMSPDLRSLGLEDHQKRLADDLDYRNWHERQWQNLRTTGFLHERLGQLFANIDGDQYTTKYSMPDRPGFNESGKAVKVSVNAYEVKSVPNKTVHQFDIIVGSGAEKRGLIRAIWESQKLQKELGEHWLFDGNKIGWTMNGIKALSAQKVPIDRQRHTFEVDMDAERGEAGLAAENATVQRGDAPPRPRRDNKFKVQVRYATSVNLAALGAFLKRQMEFDTPVLEAMNFMSHLLRNTPSKKLIAIKNSFYPKNVKDPYLLSGGLLALKGAFQSLRMAQGAKLVVNVDVSHACFYQARRVDSFALEIAGCSQEAQFIGLVKKHQPRGPNFPYLDSPTLRKVKQYLRKLSFTVKYPNASERVMKKRWIIKEISYDTAATKTFSMTDRQTGEERTISVRDYFREQYGMYLQHPHMPLIETTKKGVFYPMEVCMLEPSQRYPFKLDETQTAEMIKLAVARPEKRFESIQQGLANLNWQGDPTLQAYNLRISPQMIETNARLLDPPRVQFGQDKFETPGTSGRWRIDQKQFLKANAKPLQSWGICVINSGRGRNEIGKQEVIKFARDFIQAYKSYGGTIVTATPAMTEYTGQNPADAVEALVKAMRNLFGNKTELQLMIIIMPMKNTDLYNRIKRSCDLRYSCVSQCLQAAHVKKGNPQYISNVLMKVNAKLGGQSFKARPLAGPGSNNPYFRRPTMIIGADVSHPGPGSLQPSMAAITCSMDREGIRYGSAVQSNGHRLEMITTWNWNDMLGPMVREWMTSVGGGRFPVHIYYFRDGVSEGQFQHVMKQEVRDIRNVISALDQTPDKVNLKALEFTVVVASKRHHVRFFPKPGPASDKNRNACPGVLVERDITSPFGYDFYLCSHSAIQGTARPTHYTVLMDQAKMAPSQLQNMIYEHCYQYIRSSTPVSLYPAVYYAHLASRRAVAHERTGEDLKKHRSSEERERNLLLRAKGEADMTGKVMTQEAIAKLKEYLNEEYPPLIPAARPRFWSEMWFI